MAEVVKLQLVEVGEGYRFEADQLLDAAKGQAFGRMMIIGQLEDGDLWISGTANLGESLVLMKHVEQRLVFGE